MAKKDNNKNKDLIKLIWIAIKILVVMYFIYTAGSAFVLYQGF